MHCLTELKTAQGVIYYYVLERLERKKYILESNHLIKSTLKPFRSITLNDDIRDSMEVISYELGKMAHS